MDSLPAPVRDLALRLGATAQPPPARISFLQEGRMRQDAGSRWMRFRARQWNDVQQCQFDWRARFGPLGMVRVRDALVDGEGRLDARLMGLFPLASASGPQTTKGELMRYLAELAWCPDAILHNRHISWEVLSPAQMLVSARIGEVAGTVRLDLDGDGRISAIFAPDRPRSIGKTLVETPWFGRFHDFHQLHGRQIPLSGEVGWTIDGEDVIVWQGRLLDWTMQGGAYQGSPARIASAHGGKTL